MNSGTKNFLAAMLIVVMSVGLTAGCGNSKEKIPPLITTTLRTENNVLEISAPFSLEKDLSVNDLGEMEAYLKESVMLSAQKDGLMIMAFAYVCDKEKIEAETGQTFTPNIEGAVIGAVGNIKTVRTSSDVSDVKINGIDGKEITGTLDIKFDGDSENTRCDFRMRAFGRGMTVWLVSVIRKPGDENKRVSDAVFNSLKLS